MPPGVGYGPTRQFTAPQLQPPPPPQFNFDITPFQALQGGGPRPPSPGGGGGGFGGMARGALQAAGGPVTMGIGALAGGLEGMFSAGDQQRELRNQRKLSEATRQQGFNEFQLRSLPGLARSEQANTLRSALFSGGLTSMLGSGGFRGNPGQELAPWEQPQPGGSLFGGLANVASDYWRPRSTQQLSRLSGFEVETPELEGPSRLGGFARGALRGLLGR